MEINIETTLNYIQLYTNCNDHALKRIKPVLEEHIKAIEKVVIVEKVVVVEKFIRKDVSPSKSIEEWSEEYFNKNNVTYNDVSKKCRKTETLKIRNTYCKSAFVDGYGCSEIGRYLKRDHTTILHNIHHMKRA